MKDSGIEWIGNIPEQWNTIRFKHLHNGLNTGESIDKNYWSTDDNDTVFYTAGLEPIRTSFKDFPAWKYTNSNDLLLARNGTPYVYLPPKNACYTDHIIRAAMKEDINKRFVRYSLQQSISSVVVESVSLATWSASRWNQQAFAWPSPAEQRRIADFLDRRCAEIDRVIDATQQTIAEYKALKQSIITEAVTKGVRGPRPMKHSGVEWIGEIPEEWECKPIKYVAIFQPSCDTSKLKQDSIITYTPMDCIKNGYYVQNTAPFSTVTPSLTPFENGDIAIAKVTPCFENGNIAIMDNLASGFGLGSSELFVYRPIAINTQYLLYWLQNDLFKQAACATMTGTGGLKRVSPYFAKNSHLTVPSNEEQTQIVQYLDGKCEEVDRLIVTKQQLLTELESYKKSVIYEYVTGKKEV